jgi:hypothetical protein
LPELLLLLALEVLLAELLAEPVAAELALALLLELDDDPHAASRSAAAARPATLAILPRESLPAVLLMCGTPSSTSSAAALSLSPVSSLVFTEAWRGDKQWCRVIINSAFHASQGPLRAHLAAATPARRRAADAPRTIARGAGTVCLQLARGDLGAIGQ